jgi:hypothetical protein
LGKEPEIKNSLGENSDVSEVGMRNSPSPAKRGQDSRDEGELPMIRQANEKALSEWPKFADISDASSSGTQDDRANSQSSEHPHKDMEMGNTQFWNDETS